MCFSYPVNIFPQTSVYEGFVSVSMKRYLFVFKRMANW